MRISEKEREILRAELYNMAAELKKKNPGASAEDIRAFLKSLIDVSV